MRAAWLITVKELRIQLRRGTIFVLGFVAPLTLAFVMNLVFGGLGDPDAPVTFDVAILDHDGGEEAGGFVSLIQDIAASGVLELTTYDDEGAAREAVGSGDVGALWIVPDGFSEAVRSGGESELVVVGDVDSPNATSVARAIADRYATGVGTSTLAGMVALETGVVTPADVGDLAEEVASRGPVATLVAADAQSNLLDTTTNLMAGMALFFVFFTAGLPVVGVLEERDQGTLGRLLAAPNPSWSVTAGKTLAAVLLGTISLVALMIASTLLMGADWGPPVGAVLLGVAAVVAAVGVMSVGGSMAKTTEQAGNAQGIVAVVFGILGGAFVPIPGSDTGVLALLQRLTPHGWFFDGVASLQHEGVAAALPAFGVLLVMGMLTLALGLWAARWVLRR